MGGMFKFYNLNFKSLILLGALLAVAGMLAPDASAQAAAGTVTGQITDQQGAAISGAEIKLSDPTTNSVRTTESNDVGRFTMTGIPPADYEVLVTKTGFTSAKMSAQHVEVGQVLTLNIPLTIGATTTTVEVQATAGAELQTLNATIGTTITNERCICYPTSAATLRRCRFCRLAYRWLVTSRAPLGPERIRPGRRQQQRRHGGQQHRLYSGQRIQRRGFHRRYAHGCDSDARSRVSKSSKSEPATRQRISTTPPAARFRW